MNDFLNFSYNALNLLDNQIHDNIKGSFIDNFIHELQDYLKSQENISILNNIPKNANLHFAKFEGNYAICFDYSNKLIYNIPKSCIKGSEPEIGDPIKVISSNDFRIDTSGIPANSDNIDELINECSYANIPLNVNILSELYKIIDIKTDFAICKNINTNKNENIPIDDIPENTDIGDTLIFKNGKFLKK